MGLFNRKKDEPTEVVDLREPEPLKPQWGAPVPCPECGGRGYLDHIDPYREVMFQHCIECFAKYEITKASLAADDTSDAFTI